MSSRQQPQVKIKIADDALHGRYANSLVVAHTAEEFVLDFVLSLPPQPVCNARVIVHPGHLKRVIRALEQNLARYEEKYGPVPEGPDPGPDRIGFSN